MSVQRIPEIDKRLKVWVGQLQGHGRGAGFVSSVYNAQRVSQTDDVRAGQGVALRDIDGSVMLTDRAVSALPDELRRTVVAAYMWEGGVETIAGHLGVTRATLHNRLCNADRRISAWLDAHFNKRATIADTT